MTLLEKSRGRNEARGITGALFYRDGNFLQVIEGEESQVAALYDEIQKDPRHHKVSTFFREPIAQRDFADWSMAFYEIDHTADQWPAGFNDVLLKETSYKDLHEYTPKVRAFLAPFVR